MKPFDVVAELERRIAEYANAPYGVAVDSCTNALLLACKYLNVQEVTLPCKTYIGVAYSVLHAGGTIKFKDYQWQGAYQLDPYPIIDSARRFRKNMYIKDTLYCLSFHWTKHLPIGRGGMILTDSYHAYQWLKKARFDGRTEGVPSNEDTFDVPGYHFYMIPELAARGLMLMENIKNNNPDLIEFNYPDLSRSMTWKG